MGSEDGRAKERCGQFWCIVDEGNHTAIGGWACFSWRCPVCGPKREAEAMEMLRLRLEGWQEDPKAAPNFITLTCDPSALPRDIEQGTDEEDGYLRRCFAGVMRQLNQQERRQGRSRIQYVGVVERGRRSGNWHLHLVTDREIHVNRWRGVCEAHGLGRVVKGKRLDGVRGAAVYLAKYLQKGSATTGRKRRVLLHSRGCLPSLELWRWRRARGTPYRNAWSWTPERLKAQREYMRTEKDQHRLEMELQAEGPLQLRGSARAPGGGRELIVKRQVHPRFCSPVRKSRKTRERSTGPRKPTQLPLPLAEQRASSEPSQPPHGGSEEAVG